MKYIFLSIFIIYSLDIFSQKLKGVVYEEGSLKTIPFAQITNPEKSIGITAGKNGEFLVPDKLSPYLDSIQISALGYESIIIKVVNPDLGKLVLKKTSENSETNVLLFKGQKGNKSMGALSKYPIGSLSITTDSLNSEYGLRILNSKLTEGTLKKISFYIVGSNRGSNYYRIRVYNDSLDRPGKEITSKNIVVHIRKRKGCVNLNIKKYKLRMPVNGCYVSLECLNIYPKNNSFDNEKQICLTSEFDNSLLFIRDNGGKWIHPSLFIPAKKTLSPLNTGIEDPKSFTLATTKSASGAYHNLLIRIEVSFRRIKLL